MDQTYSRALLCLFAVVLGFFPVAGRSQLAGPKAGAKTITEVPFKITASGVYVLKTDLTLASATSYAITVAASDVVIDLGGHVISCSAGQDSSNSSRGISASLTSASNITVRNGTLENFRYGVYLEDAVSSVPVADVKVDGVIASNCGVGGFYVRAGSSEVRDCKVLKAGFVPSVAPYGITVDGVETVIRGNTVADLNDPGNGIGISVRVTTLGLVEGNSVTNASAGTDGIDCFAISPGAIFAVDNSVNNFGIGIRFTGNGVGKYSKNLTKNCTLAFQGGTAVGAGNN